MYVPNGTAIYHLKENDYVMEAAITSSLQHRLIFFTTVNDVAKDYSVKKYTYDGYHTILMKSGKALVYVTFYKPPLQEPIHQDIGNISCGIINLDRAWVPSLINNVF